MEPADPGQQRAKAKDTDCRDDGTPGAIRVELETSENSKPTPDGDGKGGSPAREVEPARKPPESRFGELEIGEKQRAARAAPHLAIPGPEQGVTRSRSSLRA